MIIRQTTTIIFEYPQDYLQEQEWCKTKEERWVHKSTDTLGAVYENTISYSIGHPNNSENTNNCEDEPKEDCKTCRHHYDGTVEFCKSCCASNYEVVENKTNS